MNYSEIVKDLNYDIFSTYGDDLIQSGYKYTYETDGGVDLIKFFGLIIYSNDIDTKETDNLDKVEFEDWLEDKVEKIGNLFLSASFHHLI